MLSILLLIFSSSSLFSRFEKTIPKTLTIISIIDTSQNFQSFTPIYRVFRFSLFLLCGLLEQQKSQHDKLFSSWSGLLAGIRWPVLVSKFKRMLFLFLVTLYHFQYGQISLSFEIPILILYFFPASFLHLFLSLSLNNLPSPMCHHF